MRRWERVVVMLVVVRIIYLSYLLFCPRRSGIEEEAKLQENLNQVLSQIKKLRQHHNELVARVKESPGNLEEIKNILDDDIGPKEEYEVLRRRIHSNIKELWYFVSSALSKGINEALDTEQISAILEDFAERKRSLLSDQEKLHEVDGFAEWRRSEADTVSELVQHRLHLLQNPPDCHNTSRLVCQHEKCGFGCQYHHLAYCLIYAYATNRTLVLKRSDWERNVEGWTNMFLPLSETCTWTYLNDSITPFSASYEINAKVLSLSISKELHEVGLRKFLPHYIPQDIARRIFHFNSNPTSWWIGQMLKYILRPERHVQEVINDTIARTTFHSPLVGVHILNSYELYHGESPDISEHMSHVHEYYAQLELTRAVTERRVYLAIDNPAVLQKAVKKYHQYTFYGYYTKPKWKSVGKMHYTPKALTGLLVNLYMLSMCDHVVGSFRNNVGRMVFEMMQTNRMDASNSFVSLDHNVYYFYRREHYRIAVIRNRGNGSDVSFDVGDLIDVGLNYGNGTAYGTVLRTNISGVIPWYKTAEHMHPHPMYKQNNDAEIVNTKDATVS